MALIVHTTVEDVPISTVVFMVAGQQEGVLNTNAATREYPLHFDGWSKMTSDIPRASNEHVFCSRQCNHELECEFRCVFVSGLSCSHMNHSCNKHHTAVMAVPSTITLLY